MKPFDPYCQRGPSEIPEYVDAAKELGITPEEYVEGDEGTFNRESVHFACTECYIKIGMPSGERGWVVP